jgi:hypothetical protein
VGRVYVRNTEDTYLWPLKLSLRVCPEFGEEPDDVIWMPIEFDKILESGSGHGLSSRG